MPSRETPKTLAGRTLAIALGCLVAFIAAEVIVRIVWPQWREFDAHSLIRRVNVDGFGSVEIGRAGFDRYISDRSGEYRFRAHINESGHRQTESIAAAHSRIWAIGDSHSFGWGVADDQTYSAVVGRLLGTPIYNLASPARNVCDYRPIVARVPAEIRPKAVVVGVVPEVALRGGTCADRTSSNAAPDRQASLQSRMAAVDSVLVRNSALYATIAATVEKVAFANTEGKARSVRPKTVAGSGDASAIALRLADNIHALQKILPRGVPTIVLIAPGQDDLSNNDLAIQTFRPTFVTALQARQIAFVDIREMFERSSAPRKFFLSDGHWSETGHLAVAQGLVEALRAGTVPGRL